MLRGYAIVNKDNEVVTSTHKLNENDQISLTMKDEVSMQRLESKV